MAYMKIFKNTEVHATFEIYGGFLRPNTFCDIFQMLHLGDFVKVGKLQGEMEAQGEKHEGGGELVGGGHVHPKYKIWSI